MQKEQTKSHQRKKNKNSLLYFLLYTQAVLLKCDHELGLNLANSQIYSQSQIIKEVENFHF